MALVSLYFSHLTDILDVLADALIIFDSTGKVVQVNRQAEMMFGYEHADFLGRVVECLMPMRFRDNHDIFRQHYLKGPKPRRLGTNLELFGLKKDGSEFPVDISLSILPTEVGQFTVAVIVDNTERKNLERSEAMITAAVKNMDDAIIGKDLEDKIILWNKGAEKLFGYSKREVIGQPLGMLVPQKKKNEFKTLLQKLVNGEHILEFETIRVHKNGDHIPVSINITPVQDAQGRPIGGVGVVRDISKHKKSEAKLKYLAEHDALTGLMNRMTLKEHIYKGMHWKKRRRDFMTICFLDIDGFKIINDSYGHSIGDKFLIATSRLIEEYIRGNDSVARVGGDEFAIVLIDVSSQTSAIKIIKRLLRRFAKGFVIDGIEIKTTLSIGLAFYPMDGDQMLLEKADAAMYYVKQNGKNNYKTFDENCTYEAPIRSLL